MVTHHTIRLISEALTWRKKIVPVFAPNHHCLVELDLVHCHRMSSIVITLLLFYSWGENLTWLLRIASGRLLSTLSTFRAWRDKITVHLGPFNIASSVGTLPRARHPIIRSPINRCHRARRRGSNHQAYVLSENQVDISETMKSIYILYEKHRFPVRDEN